MGNKLTCCFMKDEADNSTHARRNKHVEDKYMPSHESEHPLTASAEHLSGSTNLQHISEREPDGMLHTLINGLFNQFC